VVVSRDWEVGRRRGKSKSQQTPPESRN
jgi:hypothetical protein